MAVRLPSLCEQRPEPGTARPHAAPLRPGLSYTVEGSRTGAGDGENRQEQSQLPQQMLRHCNFSFGGDGADGPGGVSAPQLLQGRVTQQN